MPYERFIGIEMHLVIGLSTTGSADTAALFGESRLVVPAPSLFRVHRGRGGVVNSSGHETSRGQRRFSQRGPRAGPALDALFARRQAQSVGGTIVRPKARGVRMGSDGLRDLLCRLQAPLQRLAPRAVSSPVPALGRELYGGVFPWSERIGRQLVVVGAVLGRWGQHVS